MPATAVRGQRAGWLSGARAFPKVSASIGHHFHIWGGGEKFIQTRGRCPAQSDRLRNVGALPHPSPGKPLPSLTSCEKGREGMTRGHHSRTWSLVWPERWLITEGKELDVGGWDEGVNCGGEKLLTESHPGVLGGGVVWGSLPQWPPGTRAEETQVEAGRWIYGCSL